MENGTALIRLEGVKKVFFTEEMETHALADIHLEILDGEFAEVMGPSGCGKSTLLSLVGLLDTPTEGDYWLDGEPVANLTASERARVRNRHIGFIFQAFNLIGDLHVPRHGRRRAQGTGAPGTRARRHEPPHGSLPLAALGRSAAEGRGGARRGG
jgi:putative ABC transport system ATP-binding protein